MHVASSQDEGPTLVPLNIKCCNIINNQKRPIMISVVFVLGAVLFPVLPFAFGLSDTRPVLLKPKNLNLRPTKTIFALMRWTSSSLTCGP